MREYEPDGPVLSAFVADRSEVAIIQGAIGSGTSSGCVMRAFSHMCEQRPGPDGIRRSRWGVIRNTYPSLEGTTIKTWLEWLPEDEFGRMVWRRPPTQHIRIGDVECEVVFLALDSPDDIQKLRSSEWTGFWFNELQFISKAILDEADSRVGRYPREADGGSEWVGIIGDMNAPEPGHYINLMRGDEPFPDWMTEDERAEFEVPETWRFFVQPPAVLEVKDAGRVTGYKVNPHAENLRWLRPDYYRRLLVGKSREFIRTRLMNVTDIYVDGKPVWGDFRRELHVARQPIEPYAGYPIIVGMDFGRTPAAVALQVVRDRVYVLAEVMAQDASAAKFAPVVKAEMASRFPGYSLRFWGDPSADRKHEVDEYTAFQIFRKQGMEVFAAPGENIQRVRIEAVEGLLTRMYDGGAAFLVDPRCRTLISAMQGQYHFPRIKGTQRLHEDPAKNPASHVAEALQYGVLGAGFGRDLTRRDAGQKPINTRRNRKGVFGRHREHGQRQMARVRGY